MDFNMIRIGFHLNIITAVTMVLIYLNATEINGEPSGGFRGNVIETIRKSPNKIIHTIEVKITDQSEFTHRSTLRDPIFTNRRPGEQILQNDTDVTVTCLRGWKEPDCLTCAHGWKEPDCQTCAHGWKEPDCQTWAHGWKEPDCLTCTENYGPPRECTSCLSGWQEPNCQTCAHGWKEPGCLTCTENYGPPEDCTSCLTGWAGENCSECAANFTPPGQCDECLKGWKREYCDSCDTNFEPPGLCNRCVLGWAGENCDVCEFGFNTTSNCTECIQNGKWAGKWIDDSVMTAYQTFYGPGCSIVVEGSTTHYTGHDRRISYGIYVNTAHILRMITEGHLLEGDVDLMTKRINGTISYAEFRMNYQGSHND